MRNTVLPLVFLAAPAVAQIQITGETRTLLGVHATTAATTVRRNLPAQRTFTTTATVNTTITNITEDL